MKTSMTPLFFLLGLPFGLGCASTFEHTETTTAPREALWLSWTDVEEWPSWDTELEYSKLEGEGAFRPGAKGRLKAKGSPKARFEVVSVEQNQGYHFVVDLPGASLELKRFISKEASASAPMEFTHRVSFTGPMGWFFSLLLKSDYEKLLPVVMTKLKEQAEAKHESDQ